MQRGFGMGKQLLILNAWLCWGGSASPCLTRASCLPHWCQIVQLHYWWGQVLIGQNDAALDDHSSAHDTDGIHLLYSCIHVLIRACVSPYSFSHRCSWWGLIQINEVSSYLLPLHHPKRTLICPRFPIIFNHAPLRLTLNFELTCSWGERPWRLAMAKISLSVL